MEHGNVLGVVTKTDARIPIKILNGLFQKKYEKAEISLLVPAFFS